VAWHTPSIKEEPSVYSCRVFGIQYIILKFYRDGLPMATYYRWNL